MADSLRYDVAATTPLPFLSRVAALHRCAAAANFTLPAHAALFAGFLPLPQEGVYQVANSTYRRLLRSRGARAGHENVGLLFPGPSIIEACQLSGREVLGTGGVQFFNPSTEGINLGRIFRNFVYDGAPSDAILIDSEELARAEQRCAIPAAHAALRLGVTENPWFLFVNSAATHFPYVCRGSPISAQDHVYFHFIMQAAYDKAWPYRVPTDLRDWGLAKQMSALKVIDSELDALIGKLRQRNSFPILLLVLADHGEAFGEEGYVGHGINTQVVLEVPLWIGEIRATAA